MLLFKSTKSSPSSSTLSFSSRSRASSTTLTCQCSQFFFFETYTLSLSCGQSSLEFFIHISNDPLLRNNYKWLTLVDSSFMVCNVANGCLLSCDQVVLWLKKSWCFENCWSYFLVPLDNDICCSILWKKTFGFCWTWSQQFLELPNVFLWPSTINAFPQSFATSLWVFSLLSNLASSTS